MTTTSSPRSPRRTGRRVAVGIGVAAVVAVAAITWYLLRPAPPAVDIDAAVGSAQTGQADDGGPDSATTSADGAWRVDTSVGSFSVTQTTGTFVGFRIDEELSTIGAAEAVGRTPEVTGTITIDGRTLTDATVTADLTAIESDQPRRDGRIQDALQTDEFPDATFTLTEPVDLGTVPVRDERVTVQATGDLTIHGITREVTVPLEAVWTDELVVVTGSLDVVLADHGVTPPSAPMVVSVADTATVELQLFLTRDA